ncbi:MAG: nicotinate-nucleotide adenylyltransferase [Methylococcales bacterium]|nr:nicotinate-nucleotide adenylyltransferase [Methylococcales bacterium]
MIGIYGGTFDPVHFGHLRTALEVSEIFELDEMRLIPCAQPAHKDLPVTSAEMRLAMLSQAIENHPQLSVDRRELDREGVSYMVDTLKSLRAELPDQSLLLFIGTDAFKGLSSWYQWPQLFDYAHIVVMTRPSYQLPELSAFLAAKLTDNKQSLNEKKAGCLSIHPVTQLDISATAIRAIFKQGLDPSFLLPECVIDTVRTHQLYID